MQNELVNYHPFTAEESDRIHSVRGWLAFFVFCCHFSGFLEKPFQDNVVFSRIFNSGYSAICVFFAVSGLLLIHSFLKTNTEHYFKYPWIHFFTKRIFRIFPLWLAATIIHVVYSGKYDLGIYFKSLFFLDVMGPFKFNEVLAPISWSLYVEEFFYLSFPLIFLAIKRNWLILALLLCTLFGSLLNNFVVVPEGYNFTNPFNMLYYFGFGIAAYLFWPVLKRAAISPWFFYCIFLTQIIYVSLIEKNEKFTELNILFSVLFILQAPKGLTKVTHSLFNLLGKLCFPFYLVHSISIHFARDTFIRFTEIESGQQNGSHQFAIFILSFLISLLASLILHRTIERPFITIGSRISPGIQNGVETLLSYFGGYQLDKKVSDRT